MTGEDRLKEFTRTAYQKTITEVAGHIYHFLGYGHSNAIAIEGDTSVILVDTLDSDVRGSRLRQEIEKKTDKPVKTIIYTHGHPDHSGGAVSFKDTVEEIIAFTGKKPLKYFERILPFLNDRGRKQFGYGLADEEAVSQGIGIREGKETGEGSFAPLKPTTVYEEDKVSRIIDGIELELVRAPGECDDEIFVYLPREKVICIGDNYVGCFPNLYAIRGTQYRDVSVWVESLERILSYDSEYALPGHGGVLSSREEIQRVIGDYKDGINSILMQTLECMAAGMTLADTLERVVLEEKYAKAEYFQEYYGTLEWSIKSIYNGYVGWFDGAVSQLLPVSQKEYHRTLFELIGQDKLLKKIKGCMEKEEFQMALQLMELMEGEDTKELRRECLLQRAKQMTSANARHYFIASAKDL